MNGTPDRLYGLPGAEDLHDTPAGVWEAEIEPLALEGEVGADGREFWIIEEHTVLDSFGWLPSAVTIVEWVHEFMLDDYGAEVDPLAGIEKRADVLGAAEWLRRAMASHVTWHWADRKVAEHRLTLEDDGRPFLDGEPLYVPRADA